MNLVIGAEAAQFPEKEYINGIFVAVQDLAHRAEKNTVFFFVFSIREKDCRYSFNERVRTIMFLASLVIFRI